MAIAQQLYEGVDITGEGTVGLITYMRTDSCGSPTRRRRRPQLRHRALRRGLLSRRPRQYKTKAGAQDAHEAIRPSDVDLTPGGSRAILPASSIGCTA